MNEMMNNAMALFTMYDALKVLDVAAAERRAALPEPEFKPFRFAKAEVAEVRAEALAPANTARDPRTLEELGVPGEMARELEASFRALGLTRGDRVARVTFRAVDGTSYALKTSAAPSRTADELAA